MADPARHKEPIIAKGGLLRLAYVIAVMIVAAAMFRWIYVLTGGPPLH